MKFETKATHIGHEKDKTGSVVTPIYQTSTFEFENVDDGADKFLGKKPGYIYTRVSNPTTTALEKCMASLENTEDAVAFASGMASIMTTICTFAQNGDHVISGDVLYGGTHALFDSLLPKYGIEFTFVDTTNISNIEKAIKENTKVIYLETPDNPMLKISDIKVVAELAKKRGILLVVDNTFMSPYLQNPIDLGAGIVIHSMTKYIGGHSDAIGGMSLGKKEFMDKIRLFALDFGGCIDPFCAWLMHRGVKTLALRMEKSCSNAMKIAKFLESHPKIKKVFYPGLKSHPQHELAKKQMRNFGGMISFEVEDFESGKRLVNSTKLCVLAVSLGAVESLIEHPASMTHSPVPKKDREKTGITDGLVRLSVGIENVDDIIEDLKQALDKI